MVVVVVALSAGIARADGDPASDVLLSQDVFVPYSGMSATVERRLFALCAAAAQAGYPLKIALIASKSDLGVVPALFNRPQAYARFLSAELGSVVREPVLVVMPAGLGLATQGRAMHAAAAAEQRMSPPGAATRSRLPRSTPCRGSRPPPAIRCRPPRPPPHLLPARAPGPCVTR